jgi:hypothetical protein
MTAVAHFAALLSFPHVATATFANGTLISTDLTTYTFSTHAIGTASADRLVVVAILSGAAASPRSVSSVTIGGNAATLYGTQSTNTVRARAAFAGLLVTSGTTADIAVTFSGAMEQAMVTVWALTGAGASFAPHDVRFANMSAGSASTSSLIVPQGGAVIAGGYFIDTTAGLTGVTWTGPTEVLDAGGETANGRYSGASLSNQTASAGYTVTATPNLDSDLGGVLCAASFAPV